MPFVPGQTVVHPHHGPSVLAKVFTRKVKGASVKYARLDVQGQELAVAIPLDRLEEVGVREVMDAEQISKVLGILADESAPFEKVWSRRIKAAQDKVSTGDASQIAAVVRDLYRRETDSGISFGERTLMRDAREPLVAEMAIGLGVDAERAGEIVDHAILEREVPEIGSDKQLAPAS
ncbi:MAG: CarD family transcriptional regulator [Actinomycetaceae bacterium]